jgi:hypothetical protein
MNKKDKTSKRTSVIVDTELDFEFKKIASRKFHFQKGWYSNAIFEAMELWIKANGMILLNQGVTPMTRFVGSRMWNFFNDTNPNDNDSKIHTMRHVFDYYQDCESLKNIDYDIADDKFTCKVNTARKSGDCNFEELLDKKIIPMSLVARAGMEDMTGDPYKINRIKVDKKGSKIELAKSGE